MSIIYAARVPQALRDRFEGTDRCKAIRANMAEHKFDRTWFVEHAREHHDCLEVWLFATSGGSSLPHEHIHVTEHPDRTESTVSIHFLVAGEDRLRVKDYPHGPSSPS